VSSVAICNLQDELSFELAIWLTSFPAPKRVDFSLGPQFSDDWKREFAKRIIERKSTITLMSFGDGIKRPKSFLS
jgi:hypothetical protein